MTRRWEVASLGFVTALADEAHTLTNNPNIDWQTSPHVVEQCGVGSENASTACERVIAKKVAGLVSWGTAGSLHPDCAPGDIVVYESTQDSQGRLFRCDASWIESLQSQYQGIDTIVGPGYCADSAVASKAQKAELARRSNFLAVDMESAALGAQATAAGIPFIVLRVIVDAFDFSLPACVNDSVDAKGQTHAWPVLRGLARRPHEILPLVQLARCYAAALRRLRSVATQLQPGFGFGYNTRV